MKKIFLGIILSLFFAVNAGAMSGTYMQSIVGIGSVVCDDCSGTLKFAWHMEDNDSTPDVTLGNPCGCSDGDTIGAETGSPGFSSVQKSDGTYSLHINALDECYTFDISSDDIVIADDVKITFDIYIVSFPSDGYNHYFLEINKDVENYLQLRIETEGINTRVRAIYEGNDVICSAYIAATTGSMLSCEFQIKTGVTGNDTYLICAAESVEEDNDLSAIIGETTALVFGDTQGTEAGEYYLDNVKIDPCDRY